MFLAESIYRQREQRDGAADLMIIIIIMLVHSCTAERQYRYNGLQKCLPQSISIKEPISFNMDDLSIDRRSKNQFWSILCFIIELSNIRPMAVANCGANKKVVNV